MYFVHCPIIGIPQSALVRCFRLCFIQHWHSSLATLKALKKSQIINPKFSLLNCIGFIKNWMFLTVLGVYLCSVSLLPDLCSLPTCGLCCPAEGCKAMVCWAVCWYGKGTVFFIPTTSYGLTRNGSHGCLTHLQYWFELKIQWSC